MSKNHLFPIYLLLAFAMYSCGPSQPARTNVLAKPPANRQPPQQQTKQQNQTVFKTPQQQVGEKQTVQPKYTPPPVEREQAKNESDLESESPAPRSKQWYAMRERELQVSAKQTYYRVLDSVNRAISLLPSNTSRKPDVNQPEWHATTNFNMRKPNFVVLHHTAQNTVEQTLYTFAIPRTQVSAHYVVSRDGVVYHLLNDYLRAWHAGNSRWGNINDINSTSIGIEIDNNGTEPFSDSQINALLKLLNRLKDEYGIPQANFIAHSDIAPSRKKDPSKFFPWKKLADAGFSYWYDVNNLQTPPADFNALLALRVIGYDISNQGAAIQAFKLHYIQNDTSPKLSDYDKTVLYNVYMKY